MLAMNSEDGWNIYLNNQDAEYMVSRYNDEVIQRYWKNGM